MRTRVLSAGRLERFLAFLLDTLLLLIPIRLAAGAFITTDAEGVPAADPIFYPIIFLIKLVYYAGFTAGRWQATPGKRILGLHVIRTDHRRLTVRDGAERFLAFTLPFLPAYVSFMPNQISQLLTLVALSYWFMPILYSTERVGVHDRLCRTRVVIGKVGA